MSTNQKGTRILARTFFNQLRASGYTPQQIIGMATELLDLVTESLREGEKEGAKGGAKDVLALQSTPEVRPDLRPEA